jgi:hypothetical protein
MADAIKSLRKIYMQDHAWLLVKVADCSDLQYVQDDFSYVASILVGFLAA